MQGQVKFWTSGVLVDDKAIEQIREVASMPFIYKHIAVMPDAHWGTSCTIGSVIATKGAIIPAAVGVDLSCGMEAVKTSLVASDLPDNLHGVRSAIEAAVPHGRTDNGGPNDSGSWGDAPDGNIEMWNTWFSARYDIIVGKHPKIKTRYGPKHVEHLGTLGAGNHFIEICLDEDQCVWIMLHSGSRGVGNRIGTYFIELAKKDMKTWFIDTPNVDLAYFPEGTRHFDNYIEAVGWAQDFASANRSIMLQAVNKALFSALHQSHRSIQGEHVISCHHNYVAREHHFGSNVLVTRKGAVNAREGVMGIVPGSMGAKSYIVRGKGNPESFHSCSHGAGRAMSRGEARKTITVEDHAKAVSGVECRLDSSVIDESPAAYKPIDDVMAAQSDLVEIVHTLKQVVNVKG